MLNEVSVIARDTYGTTRYYPVSEAAIILAKIAQTKTLSVDTLRNAKQLGFTINIQTATLEL